MPAFARAGVRIFPVVRSAPEATPARLSWEATSKSPSTLFGVVGFDVVGEDVVKVEVRQLDPELPLPAYARPGDAGADLRASRDVTIPPAGGRALVPTGLALAIPEGYAGFVQPRSGLALRHGVTVLNAPGLIDAGYRDELMVLLVNTDPVEPYEVRRGDRVAQLVVKAVAQAEFVAVGELPPSERGLGGFGHSGR
jgi:dUTP pyrophosphatase